MTISRGPTPISYTKISNAVAQDAALPSDAKGVWLYLITKPGSWKILPKWLSQELDIGRDKMYRLLNVLIEHKLCQRKQERVRQECGREVLGPVEYIIYGEPEEWKDSVVPCFQDTDFEDPENQYTTNNRLEIKKEEQQQRPPVPVEPRPAPKTVVVVPSDIQSIQNLKAKPARDLIAAYGVDRIREKLPLLAAEAEAVENPFGFLKAAIEGDWKPKQVAADRIPGNRKWAKDVMHGKVIGPVRVEALNGGLEFIYNKGQTAPDCFDYSLSGFRDVVAAHYRKILAKSKER